MNRKKFTKENYLDIFSKNIHKIPFKSFDKINRQLIDILEWTY